MEQSKTTGPAPKASRPVFIGHSSKFPGGATAINQSKQDFKNDQKMPPRFADHRQLGRYLSRHSDRSEIPEGQLIIAVLEQAWQDAGGLPEAGPRRKREARRFFTGGGAEHWCNLIGFQGDIKELFERHHPVAEKRSY